MYVPELSFVHRRQLDRDGVLAHFNSGDHNWGVGRKRGGQGVCHLNDPLTERSPGYSIGSYFHNIAEACTHGQVDICLGALEVVEY